MSDLILQSITRALPPRFIRAIASDFEWAYREAHAASYRNPLLDEYEADYHYPHHRRSILEKRFRDSASKEGLSVEVRRNQANNYNYTEITSGSWSFTLKHTSDEKHMLKSSIFREQSAELNGMLPQLVMPTILGTNLQRSPSRFYAIIFHATDREDKSTPGFIRIGVPKEDFSWWAACFDVHELMGASAPDSSEEEIKAFAKWKIRADRNTEVRSQ